MPPPPSPGVPSPTTPMPAKRSFWTGGRLAALVIGVISLVGAAVIGAGVLFVRVSQDAAAQSVPTTAAIGQCFERDGDQLPVSCSGEHHFEVFSVIIWDLDAGHPSRFDLLGNDICDEDFESYTGSSYWTSMFDYTVVVPTRDEWDNGDRVGVCALHGNDLGAFSFPARDSGR